MNLFLDFFDVPSAFLVFLEDFYKNRDTFLNGSKDSIKMLDITLIRNDNWVILNEIPLVFSIGRIILIDLILHEKLQKGHI